MTQPRRPTGPIVWLLLICCAMLPPAGLLLWIVAAGADRGDYLRSAWVRAGLWVLGVSALPLVLVIVLTNLGLWPGSSPNPIGPGLLFFAGGIISTVCLGVGVVLVRARHNDPRHVSAPPPPTLPNTGQQAVGMAGGTPRHAQPSGFNALHLLRAGAVTVGCLLVVIGLVSLLNHTKGRGPASLIVIGVAAIGWGIFGQLPSWWGK